MSIYLKLLILFILLLINLVISKRRKDKLDWIFFRLILIAGIFLFLIYFVKFNGGVVLNFKNMNEFLTKWSLIIGISVMLITARKIFNTDEIYAFLIDLKIPAWAIYLIFNSLFLIPRLIEKSKEILIAQEARGFKNVGTARIKATILVLVPLISSISYELEQKSIAIQSRGLFSRSKKTHIYQLSFKFFDFIIIFASVICSGLLIFLSK